jgi:uncharacterized lipoprotein YajG
VSTIPLSLTKKLLCLACVVGLILVSGCARYKITLTNGNVITAKSRPKLDEVTNMYYFKDAEGKDTWIPRIRVREIEAK